MGYPLIHLFSAGATGSSLPAFLVPVGVLVPGVVVLGEVIRSEEYAGIGIIFVGLLFVDGGVLVPIRRAGYPEGK
jgi:drug/metabolite transporter (DMT)-like permease